MNLDKEEKRAIKETKRLAKYFWKIENFDKDFPSFDKRIRPKVVETKTYVWLYGKKRRGLINVSFDGSTPEISCIPELFPFIESRFPAIEFNYHVASNGYVFFYFGKKMDEKDCLNMAIACIDYFNNNQEVL